MTNPKTNCVSLNSPPSVGSAARLSTEERREGQLGLYHLISFLYSVSRVRTYVRLFPLSSFLSSAAPYAHIQLSLFCSFFHHTYRRHYMWDSLSNFLHIHIIKVFWYFLMMVVWESRIRFLSLHFREDVLLFRLLKKGKKSVYK